MRVWEVVVIAKGVTAVRPPCTHIPGPVADNEAGAGEPACQDTVRTQLPLEAGVTLGRWEFKPKPLTWLHPSSSSLMGKGKTDDKEEYEAGWSCGSSLLTLELGSQRWLGIGACPGAPVPGAENPVPPSHNYK